MEILGIGFNELVFIIIIALIVLGPKDMQKAGRTIGRWMRSIVTSDGWKVLQQTSRELRTLPNRLMREANEDLTQIHRDLNSMSNPMDRNPGRSPLAARSQPVQPPPSAIQENTIAPPAVDGAAVDPGQEKHA
jgi:sec-independent protein translocase protein TatB